MRRQAADMPLLCSSKEDILVHQDTRLQLRVLRTMEVGQGTTATMQAMPHPRLHNRISHLNMEETSRTTLSRITTRPRHPKSHTAQEGTSHIDRSLAANRTDRTHRNLVRPAVAQEGVLARQPPAHLVQEAASHLPNDHDSTVQGVLETSLLVHQLVEGRRMRTAVAWHVPWAVEEAVEVARWAHLEISLESASVAHAEVVQACAAVWVVAEAVPCVVV